MAVAAIAQAAQVERPIVLPLSNPTPRAEAIPSDVLAVKARAVTDEMLTAAATAIGRLAAENQDGGILPPVTESRRVARHVAFAVARTAVDQGRAPSMNDDEIAARIDEASWSPVYRELDDRHG